MELVFLILLFGAAWFAVRAFLSISSRLEKAQKEKRLEQAKQGAVRVQARAWRRAARMLRLHYRPEDRGEGPSITGCMKGNEVVVSTFSKRSEGKKVVFSRFQVAYPRPLGLGLRLTSEGRLSPVAKHLGEQDIDVGDAAFDEDVVVKSSDAEAVIRFLTPARRLRSQRLLALYSGAVIGDSKISLTLPGLVCDQETIVTVVRRMVHVAEHLTEDREDDRLVDRAVRARQEGRIEEAVNLLRAMPADKEEAQQPVENRVLEGEMLFVAGHREEASKIFEEARAEIPEDPEIQEWAERAAAEPPPLEELEETEAATGLDLCVVCDELFDPRLLSLDSNRIFDEKYKGCKVRWSGTLTRVEAYPFDFVFGNEPGTKAVFVLHEMDAPLYGKKQIAAVVQLPPEAHDVLKPLAGQEVAFEGRLESVDGFVNNLYVAKGQLQGELTR